MGDWMEIESFGLQLYTKPQRKTLEGSNKSVRSGSDTLDIVKMITYQNCFEFLNIADNILIFNINDYNIYHL